MMGDVGKSNRFRQIRMNERGSEADLGRERPVIGARNHVGNVAILTTQQCRDQIGFSPQILCCILATK
jgi:hypothetical protein